MWLRRCRAETAERPRIDLAARLGATAACSRAGRCWPLAWVLACNLTMLSDRGHAQNLKREPRAPVRELTLRLAEPAEAARLELQAFTPERRAAQRVSTTDLLVRLKAPHGQAMAAVLALPNATPEAKPAQRVVFTADLLIVADGQIRNEEGAQCGPWRADVSLCQIACEGGTFAIVRRIDGGQPSLRIIFGQMPAGNDEPMKAGVWLAQCRESIGLEWSLAPAAGARQVSLLLRVE